MIAALYPGSGVRDVPAGATALHLVRPVRKKVLEQVLKKCSAVERVSASRSCLGRMGQGCRELLEKRGIEVAVETRPGRAISVPLEKMLHALEMRKDYQSLREIERVTGISKSTVHYLEKYAQRAKVKNGKKVVYLK